MAQGRTNVAEARKFLRTLIIGDLPRWQAEGRDIGAFDGVQFLSFDDLTQQTLTGAPPAIILSPLVADDFDAFDVAAKLADFGYHGRYRAITALLADVQVIKSEICHIAPDLDFDILPLR